MYSQVDERQCIGRLAFTAAHAEERSKCNPCENLITLQEKIPCHAHHTFQAWANLLRCTPHKRKSSRDIRSVQEKHLTDEVVRVEQEEVRDFLTISQEKTQSKENMKPYRDSEKEFHTGVLLEQYRNQTLSEENFKIIPLESRAQRAKFAIQNLDRQLLSQHIEIYHRDQELWSYTKRISVPPCRISKPRESSPRCSY